MENAMSFEELALIYNITREEFDDAIKPLTDEEIEWNDEMKREYRAETGDSSDEDDNLVFIGDLAVLG